MSTSSSPSAPTSTPASTDPFPSATIVGYPRIGPHRELKRAQESLWADRISADEFEARAAELRGQARAELRGAGLTEPWAIPESFSAYDQVLDTALAFGIVPARFADAREAAANGQVSIADYSRLARGDEQRPPLELTKWFDTNYHYLVPELSPVTPLSLAWRSKVAQLRESIAQGIPARPTLIGPLSLLLLAKPDLAETDPADGFDPLDRLDDLVPLYAQLLGEFAEAGAQWVQLDESALVADGRVDRAELPGLIERSLGVLGALEDRPHLLVVTGYGDASDLYGPLATTGIEALHIDVSRTPVPAPSALEQLADLQLAVGAVDGRSVWRTDLTTAFAKLTAVRDAAGGARVAACTSVSLQHLPVTLEAETQLDPALAATLSFAREKVQEVALLGAGLADPSAHPQLAGGSADGPRSVPRDFPGVRDDAVRARTATLTDADRTRASDAERAVAQQERLGLPLLPTTTIGSFPQTGEIRAARAAHRRGDLSDEAYTQAMREQIADVIALQEELGLDVLVHGEAERNDMVQYFAENFDGFAVTQHGWVQSYGSRCTRPSLLFGDVSRPRAFTVPWIAHAASLTEKPVKGMLTGPVTILAWSFVRDDQPLAETADQVALALRDEITDLEAAGIPIIQVDEPALRELLPLRVADREEYLRWSVGAFRLATGGAQAATQIHTHLCYSEFNAVVEAISGLGADVTSIESARSQGEIVDAVDPDVFPRDLGPGVWDIHSPRVPSVEEVEATLAHVLAGLPPEQVWVNPDCGLKTRGYEETIASLRNLVTAAREARERIGASVAA